MKEDKVLDLTHPFNEDTVYWPTSTKFELKRVAFGPNASGKWYASCDFTTSEHGGTHLDAPIHFAEGKWLLGEIPVSRLMGPARVLDIRQNCEKDRDYLLSPEDIESHEALHGRIPPDSVVLVLTGFGARYPDLKRYLGTDVRGSIEGLHFPGIGEDAARILVERKIDLVGIDTASLDHGPSQDFKAHRVLAAANIPGLENIAQLDRLPPRGAWVIALPIKIEKGTGGPCRILAVLP